MVSVLYRIAPLETFAPVGRCAVVPDGNMTAPVLVKLAICVEAMLIALMLFV
jgi:hypothetical protein